MMVLWSPKSSSHRSLDLAANVKNCIIFIFGYLPKGFIIMGIKKSITELPAIFAWSAELTKWHIIAALTKAGELARVGRIRNETRMDLIRISARLQTSSLGISLAILNLCKITRMQLTGTNAVSIPALLKKVAPLKISENLPTHDDGSQQDQLPEIEIAHFDLKTDPKLERYSDKTLTNESKRINLSEIFKEENVEDELVHT